MTEVRELLKNRRDAEHQLIAKAWSDEAFAEKLRANPNAAVEEELGLRLPADYKVMIHEEKPGSNTWHLVIPDKPQSESDELVEVDQASVAGEIKGLNLLPSINIPKT
jgi:hypothetical protein